MGKVRHFERPTASRLGIRVYSLVVYNKKAWHVCHIDSPGMKLILKRCSNAEKMADGVSIYDVKVVPGDHKLYERYGIPARVGHNSQEEDLFALTGTMNAMKKGDSELRKELILRLFKEIPYIGMYFERMYSPKYNYRLKPNHIETRRVMTKKKVKPPKLSLWQVLSYLDARTWEPLVAADHWIALLNRWDPYVWPVCECFLVRQFGNVEYEEMRKYMKLAKSPSTLPRKELL